MKIKETIKKFIDDIAKENQKSFGTEKLDCCKLNKDNNGSVNK